MKNEEILQMERCLSETGWKGYVWKYFCTDVHQKHCLKFSMPFNNRSVKSEAVQPTHAHTHEKDSEMSAQRLVCGLCRNRLQPFNDAL